MHEEWINVLHYQKVPLVDQHLFRMQALAIRHALEDNLSPNRNYEINSILFKNLDMRIDDGSIA